MTAVLFAIMLLSDPGPGPLEMQGGGPPPSVIAATDRPTALRFSDGSCVRAAVGAYLFIEENSEESMKFALKKGRAKFDITPGGPRVWRVDCGQVTVTVLGTAFSVEKTAKVVSVNVERGVVLVTGDGIESGARQLTAGDSIRIDNSAKNPAAAVPPPSAFSTSWFSRRMKNPSLSPNPNRRQKRMSDLPRLGRKGRKTVRQPHLLRSSRLQIRPLLKICFTLPTRRG